MSYNSAMSHGRKEIYIGERLRSLLDGKGQKLTTVVNSTADRYLAIIEKQSFALTGAEVEVLRGALAELREPAGRRELLTLPALVDDYAQRRHSPEGEALARRLEPSSIAQRAAAVEQAERSGA